MSQIDTSVIDKLTDKPKPASLDINAKVKIGDKEFTVAELIAERANITSLQSRLEALETESKTTKSSVSKMLSGQGTEEDARAMLKSLGYSGDQIEAYVEANFRAPAKGGKGNDGGTLGDESDKEETVEEKLLAKIAELEARLDETSESGVQDRLRRIGESLENEVRTRIKSNPYFKDLLAAKKRVDKDVDEGKILDIFAGRARDEATKALREKRKVAGSFDETWIPGEVEKAVKSVVTEHQTSFVDPKFIGRAPEVVMAEEEARNAPPAPEPSYSPGKARAAIEADAEKYLTDGLTKMALGMSDTSNV